MKIEILRPASKEEALDYLEGYRGHGAALIAGGTDLLMAMRAKVVNPGYLIDLAGAGLDYIAVDGGCIRVGALCTFNTIAENSVIRQKIPVLSEAAGQIGAVQTRNLATIGGNLCSAVPSCDSAPALMVLNASMCLCGPGKHERAIPIEKFFLGPRRTILSGGEILEEIKIPIPPRYSGASFIKFGRRKALTLAVVNAAASITLEEDLKTVAKASIALGAVAPTPIRAYRAEEQLAGKQLTESLILEAARIAADETSPISDLRASAGYRRELAAAAVRRTLEKSWRQAKGDG